MTQCAVLPQAMMRPQACTICADSCSVYLYEQQSGRPLSPLSEKLRALDVYCAV